MNLSRATRILVFVSLSDLSNSSQPKRSCAFFIDIRPPSRGFRLGFTSALSSVSPLRRRLFERARLPSGEHHGEFLNEAFPLSDDGCSVRLFLRQLRRDLLALPGSDVSLFTDAKNAVDQTRTRDQANLARVKWCERPSSDYCGLRRQNSCRLTGRR